MVLRTDQDAVSAVIGVVLLAGIVVLLATGVFVMVRIFTEESVDKAPVLAFAEDPERPQLTVVKVDKGMTWDDVVLGGDCTPILNGAAYPPAPGTPVLSGDVLACQPGDELRVSSSSRNGNTLLLDHDF